MLRNNFGKFTWGRGSIKHWTPVFQLYSSAEFREEPSTPLPPMVKCQGDSENTMKHFSFTLYISQAHIFAVCEGQAWMKARCIRGNIFVWKKPLFWLCSGQPYLVWVWIWKISPINHNFLPFWSKNLIMSSQKVPWAKPGRPFIYCR